MIPHYKNLNINSITEEKFGVLIKERWLPVVGYEDSYEVSSFGRVKSLARNIQTSNRFGQVLRPTKPKILRWSKTNQGYLRVTLCRGGITTTYSIHRLVMIAFVKNINNFPQINHKSGVKQDNTLDNLEWCDSYHNQQHAVKNGLNVAHKSWDDTQSKPVLMITPNGEKFKFGSMGEASNVRGMSRSCIKRSIDRNRPILYGKYIGNQFFFL